MQRILAIASAILLLAVSGTTSADTPTPSKYSNETLVRFRAIHEYMNAVTDLAKREVITEKVATEQRRFYLAEASKLAGHNLTEVEFISVVTSNDHGASSTNPTWEKIKGQITFVNIIAVFAAFLIVFGLGWVIVVYQLYKLIPIVLWEILIYVAAISLMLFAGQISAELTTLVAFLGCLGLIGALTFTNYFHKEPLTRFYEKLHVSPMLLSSLILAGVWAAFAMLYQSELIGFITVMAVLSALGFSVIVMPLCYCIGFEEESVIPRAVGASFILMAGYAAARIFGIDLSRLAAFSTGALFMGTFVYFIGLLITTSRYYGHKNPLHYLYLQILMIISGVAAIYVGSVWQMSQLQGIGGTFLGLFLIEKYFDIPGLKKHWALATCGLGVILYVGSLVIKHYPEYFLTVFWG